MSVDEGLLFLRIQAGYMADWSKRFAVESTRVELGLDDICEWTLLGLVVSILHFQDVVADVYIR